MILHFHVGHYSPRIYIQCILFPLCDFGFKLNYCYICLSFFFFLNTLLQIFDRDEPAREKEVHLSVRATDNGQPTLDDTCTIRVVIEDVNDNPPVFDKVVSVYVILQIYLQFYWNTVEVLMQTHGQ
jgi:hypothetical protein